MPLSAEKKQQIDNLIKNEHVFVASKSYCPYCQRAKKLLDQYKVTPKVIELDEVDDGAAIQDYLAEITGQRSVPNIFIDGKHIGGSDDLAALDRKGELKSLL